MIKITLEFAGRMLVRRVVVLLLLMSLASRVSAKCTHADLVDRWDFITQGASCQFHLDEVGEVYKARCDLLFNDVSAYFISASGRISVNSYCRVLGTITAEVLNERGGDPVLEESLELSLVGRLSLDKSIIEGEAKSNFYGFISFCDGPDDSDCYNHFSMVKY